MLDFCAHKNSSGRNIVMFGMGSFYFKLCRENSWVFADSKKKWKVQNVINCLKSISKKNFKQKCTTFRREPDK